MSNVKVKKLSKKQIIIIAAVAVLVILLATTGIYCGVKQESPAQMMSDIFTDKDELINKWQGEKGVAAYEFKEDGTYDSYISTFSFSGNYTTEGNKLTLSNPANGDSVVYKYKIKKDTLTLTLLQEHGKDAEESEENVYNKVDHINTKSPTDILSDFAKDATDKTEDSTDDSN